MKTILIAEDDPSIRTLLETYLRKNGHEVLVASNGLTAITLIYKAPRIDWIITDIDMPGANGIEILHKAKEKFPNAGRIAVSGELRSHDEEAELDKIGIQGLVLKPETIPLLRRLGIIK